MAGSGILADQLERAGRSTHQEIEEHGVGGVVFMTASYEIKLARRLGIPFIVYISRAERETCSRPGGHDRCCISLAFGTIPLSCIVHNY